MRLLLTMVPVIALAVMVACNDDDEPNVGFEQVSSETGASIQVALLEGDGGDLGAGGAVAEQVILSVSEEQEAATFSLSHTYIPANWGAYDSAIEDRLRVLVVVNEEFSTLIDRVDLTVTVGDGSTIESIPMEQDALDISTYYVFLKPSCPVEDRDSDGVCLIESPSRCEQVVVDGDVTVDVSGRCDLFTVRLFEEGASDATATPTAESMNGALKEGALWIPSYSDLTTTLKGI